MKYRTRWKAFDYQGGGGIHASNRGSIFALSFESGPGVNPEEINPVGYIVFSEICRIAVRYRLNNR